MERLNEITLFEDLLTTPKNSLVEQAMEDGRIPIGYNCCTVPIPLLNVGKLFSVCLRAPEVFDTETSNFYMSSFNCSYSRSILQCAIDGNYDFLSGLVFSASCVHIHRVEHNLEILDFGKEKENFLSYVIDTPRKIFEASIEALANDLEKLAQEMSKNYGVEINKETLEESIKKYNEFNTILKEISDMRKEKNPRITGAEWHTVYAATRVAPMDLLIKPLKALKKALEKRTPMEKTGPRIMVMGSHLDNPEFTRLFEEQGCTVVADRHCFGSLPGMEIIKTTGNPYRDLAVHFLEKSECPRMMEKSQDRIDHLMNWVEEYHVDGIILEVMKFCDLWGWEVLKLQEAAKKKGIPTVKFEREYQLTGEGQMRTRVQAFIESIHNKEIDSAIKKEATMNEG